MPEPESCYPTRVISIPSVLFDPNWDIRSQGGEGVSLCKIKLPVQVANQRNNTPDAAKCTFGRKEKVAEFHPQKTSIRAWSGCDTISHFYEICKDIALHTFSNSKHLFLLGREDSLLPRMKSYQRQPHS